MNKDIAISVQGVSKTFKIPHEKVSSIRGAVTGIFRDKSYEEFKALDDVSFEVKKGEFFGIIGRNGSGKSTLLKVLAGIYQADKGRVKVNGMISPFLELGIGFNPELSGRDNVYLNATVLGMTQKQIDEKFDSIVAFSELERFIDQKLKNYSSGMQVRLAFSVSIHANRDILLMDEVLAVGDSNFQSKCLTEFAKYKDMNRTVIIVTHDIMVVQRYCDRAMLLRNGKIVKIGKAEEVGNAYVYENMSDEEKRMVDEEKQKITDAEKDLKNLKGKELIKEQKRIAEEKRKLEEERKNKVAEITRVEFYNERGELINNFLTNGKMIVMIYLEINRGFEDIYNIGFSIESDNGAYILGYTTESDTFLFDINKKSISLIFDRVPFLNGLYFVNITLFGKNNSVIFDFKPKIGKFRIFTSGRESKYRGHLNLKHNWKQ